MNPPDALLLLASGCPHCPAVLEGLSQLLKQGVIGRLEVINVQAHPEIAEQLGVRSVPWTRIGDFVLEGLHSPAELRLWAGRGDADMREYLRAQLEAGNRDTVARVLQNSPRVYAQLAALLGDPDSSLQVRLGITVLLEDRQGAGIDDSGLAAFAALLKHTDARIRTDACHALSLIRHAGTRALLEGCLLDSDAEVREIAAEALESPRE